MERKNRHPTAVPSPKDKAKENNQTQIYDILDPNVFQNISKCFPKLPAEAVTARLRLHQSLRLRLQPMPLFKWGITGALQRTPRRWLARTSPATRLPKRTRDPCAENSVSKENCLCFLDGASSAVRALDCYVGFQEESH